MIVSSAFALEFQRRFGFPISHAVFNANDWKVAVWDASIMPKMIAGRTTDILEKLWEEFENNSKTGIAPKQWEKKFNISLLTGLAYQAKLGTAEQSGSWTHNSIGTNGAGEDENHTGLQTETGTRKSFAAAGQRKVINQTQKFSMPWFDTEVGAPITLRESGVANALAAGDHLCRVAFSDKAIVAGDLFTVQISAIYVNGVVV